MSKTTKIILIFLAVDALIAGIYFGTKALSSGSGKTPMDEYEWQMIDANYQPRDFIETFIMNDASAKNIFPVYIRNYGRDTSVLKRFTGTNFARASETILDMTFPGLDDWTIIDVKYKNEKEQEIARTILYVNVKNEWKVGDSGKLTK